MNKVEYDVYIERVNRRLLEVLASDDVLEGSLRWAFDVAGPYGVVTMTPSGEVIEDDRGVGTRWMG